MTNSSNPFQVPNIGGDDPTVVYTDRPPGLTPSSLALGVVAGVLGAYGWALFAANTNMESGLVALVVGALVGLGVRLGKASGRQAALAAGVLATLAIFGGKVWSIDMLIKKQLSTMSQPPPSQETYETFKKLAVMLEEAAGDDEKERKIVAQIYAKTSASEVTAKELTDFRRILAPHLRKLRSQGLGFESWKTAYRRDFLEAGDWLILSAEFWENFIKSLKVRDFVYLFFGIFAAVRIGRGGSLFGSD